MTESIRGSNVILKDELRSSLRAIAFVNAASARVHDASEVYNAGFNACLAAICVAFDINPSGVLAIGGRHE